MDILTQMILLMMVLEFLEANLQKASTLELVIERLYGYYQKSIFLFFLAHPSFYFVIVVSLYFNLFNFFTLSVLALKSLDIFFKIEMIQQRYLRENMDEELKVMMQMKLPPWISLLGIMMYVPLMIMAFYNQ